MFAPQHIKSLASLAEVTRKPLTPRRLSLRARQSGLNPFVLGVRQLKRRRPFMGTLVKGINRFLDVYLHIGAHRTGTTTLQNAIDHNRHNLMKSDVTFWGPQRTRSGLFNALLTPASRRTSETDAGMVRSLRLIELEQNRLDGLGSKALVVSDENILGSMRLNLGHGQLYPNLRERLFPFRKAFGPRCVRVSMAIRSLDEYWASCLSYALSKSIVTPGGGLYRQLAEQPRRWQDVITDARSVFSTAEIAVWEFSRTVGQSDLQYQTVANGLGMGRFRQVQGWHNRSPSVAELQKIVPEDYRHRLTGHGRFMPFHPGQIAKMASAYAEDLAWLRDMNGKDGLVFALNSGPSRKDRFFTRKEF
jgi:hypothetical protein